MSNFAKGWSLAFHSKKHALDDGSTISMFIKTAVNVLFTLKDVGPTFSRQPTVANEKKNPTLNQTHFKNRAFHGFTRKSLST